VGPTVLAGDKEYQKRNFTETFDWPPFMAMSPVIEIGHNGKPSCNKSKKVSDTLLDPNTGALCMQMDDDQHFSVLT
jgi:hypothetical protein